MGSAGLSAWGSITPTPTCFHHALDWPLCFAGSPAWTSSILSSLISRRSLALTNLLAEPRVTCVSGKVPEPWGRMLGRGELEETTGDAVEVTPGDVTTGYKRAIK